jgi:hypothetical protein
LPTAIPIGTDPAMTVSGAAAATTMNTIEAGPSVPCSRRTGAAGELIAVTGDGSETVAMRTSMGGSTALPGRDRTAPTVTCDTCGAVTRP